MSIDASIDKHYGFGSILERIFEGLQLADKDLENLKIKDLAPIDEFHTRGLESTLELAELAAFKPTDCVLDVGCGLGGSARHIAHEHKCKVVGLDLTKEYIEVADKLTEMLGMENIIAFKNASALEMPFDDSSFDIVWTEHAQMNIADKEKFYSEISRVLKKGGRAVFHDIFRSAGDAPQYPLPWAEDESISYLATFDEAKKHMRSAGLEVEKWLPKVNESLEFFKKVLDKIEDSGPPPIGIHLLMGDNASEKLNNYVENLTKDRISVAMGLLKKV